MSKSRTKTCHFVPKLINKCWQFKDNRGKPNGTVLLYDDQRCDICPDPVDEEKVFARNNLYLQSTEDYFSQKIEGRLAQFIKINDKIIVKHDVENWVYTKAPLAFMLSLGARNPRVLIDASHKQYLDSSLPTIFDTTVNAIDGYTYDAIFFAKDIIRLFVIESHALRPLCLNENGLVALPSLTSDVIVTGCPITLHKMLCMIVDIKKEIQDNQIIDYCNKIRSFVCSLSVGLHGSIVIPFPERCVLADKKELLAIIKEFRDTNRSELIIK